MNFVRIITLVNLVWVLSEVGLVLFTRRERRGARPPRDRGSRTLFWCVIGAGLAAGTAAQAVSAARIRMPEPWLLGASLALLTAGLAIRWTAILTLGRYFNTTVIIQPHHRLIRTGLFRLVRHPSYSGLLLLFIGTGLSYGNWLSLGVIVLPFLAALLYRIHVEEASLVEVLGPEYVDYCRSTKRLLPGIY